MKVVIHAGEKSDEYLREFECKRADFCLQDISDWSQANLKALLQMIYSENRTFAEKESSAL